MLDYYIIVDWGLISILLFTFFPLFNVDSHCQHSPIIFLSVLFTFTHCPKRLLVVAAGGSIVADKLGWLN